MFASRYALARTSTTAAAALATTSIRLAASSSRRKRSGSGSGSKSVKPPRPSRLVHGSSEEGEVAAAADDVDEVERLLAATTTTRTGPLPPLIPTSPPPITAKVNEGNSTDGAVAASSSSSLFTAVLTDADTPAVLDSASALHFRAAHHTAAAHAGPTHAQREQIERRRSKLSLAEAEFEVGVTERLVPELPRLPALHEVHYGDAVVHELDRSLYFASHPQPAPPPPPPPQQATPHANPDASTVVIDGAAYVEVSLDNALSEADFAAFDAEASANGLAAASPQVSPSLQEEDEDEDESKAGSATTATNAEESVSAAQAPMVNESLHAVDDVVDPDAAAEDDAAAQPITFGTARPWFVPASGVVELEPLPPADCALLLRFLLYLRQQTTADLVPTLRRALQQVEEEEQQEKNEDKGDSTRAGAGRADANSRQSRRPTLTLADVIRYLDTAPPPVIGFTESLPAPTASSSSLPVKGVLLSAAAAAAAAVSSSSLSASASSATSPAFVFHLYLENVSSQNAIGHVATFFGLPQRCFQTHSAVSKMSCTTVLCAVAENRLRREHLLLLNTLRHPGFVLRVSSIQEVSPDRYPSQDSDTNSNGTTTSSTSNSGDPLVSSDTATAASWSSTSVSQQLFGELARWQPLYATELLLRRVCSSDSSTAVRTRQQLEHRLRAVQTLGAICFCANREASLARAATDVLHGFFKSALLNALQRRKAPVPLQRFLKQPNVATAQHAHHVSTDSTVRQVLKTYVQTNGDWHATVVRTPYVWRRRWVNALRGLVWNTMASRRLREGGREVCLGDVVLKPAFRSDVHRRGIVTVKAAHVMVVTTAAEAAAAALDDVFIPFLRGRYPEHLFAADDTHHPIMTRANMLALLRAMHAPQLLLGLTDELRLLLDVRADSSPLLFRRLIVRPVEMEFAILEDKPPMRALHYDAARLLTNDRWAAAAGAPTASTTASVAMTQQQQQQQQQQRASSPPSAASAASRCTGACHLLPPSDVLERTTLGARLTSGVLAEDFFSIPRPEDYVVLGHAHRYLSGGLVPAAPHSSTADIGDRVFTVYIRAVVEYNLAGLSNLLREYFLLSGIETEADSALQHKVHRMRRELDPETPLLTAPVYCTTCYNRGHDTQEQCAEYQHKAHRGVAQRDLITATAGPLPLPARAASTTDRITEDTQPDTHLPSDRSVASASAATAKAAAGAVTTRTVRMRLHLRRRNDEQRWGVHLTKALHLVGMEHVQLLREGAVWSVTEGSVEGSEESAEGEEKAKAMSLPGAAQASPWPASWITEAAAVHANHTVNDADGTVGDAHARSTSHGLVQFLQSVFEHDHTTTTTMMTAAADDVPRRSASSAEPLHDLLMQSPVLLLPTDPAVLQLRARESSETGKTTFAGSELLKACPWTLVRVNEAPVSTQRDVAAALLQHASKARDVWLTFETAAPAAVMADDLLGEHTELVPPLAKGSENGDDLSKEDVPPALVDALQHTTHASDKIPQSTAALPPQRRHAVEVAMRTAVQRTSPATQRWLQDLPYRLTLALSKHRRHLHKRRSWGLQLDGIDMTLVNFTRLMVQYMYASNSAEKRLQCEHATVASLAPAASFPRNDPALTARLFGEVLPKLEPLLNDMYRVVRIDNTAVHNKAEAARAMAAFQVSVDENLLRAKRGNSSGVTTTDLVESGEVPEQFFLTLALERKGSSYRLCAAAVDDAAATAATALTSPSSTTKETRTSRLSQRDHPSDPQQQQHLGSSATASAVKVDAELLDGLATPHCPVRPLTPAQLARSSVTLAINRLVATDLTRGKWGLRLQHGTRRLKAVQQNRLFSFHVFAAKQSQGTRIADTLRLVTARRTPPSAAVDGADSVNAAAVAAHVRARSFYLYLVERVNQRDVRHHAELRQELWTAAQPPPHSPIASLPPESVTLSVRQFPLLRFTVTVRRGGVGEESALGPVGLQVDRNMRISAVFAGSPMARALAEAVGPLCSVRHLVKDRNGEGSASAEADASSSPWKVIALPHLRALVVKAESVLLSDVSQPRAKQQRQWAYDLDEDEAAAASHSASTPSRTRSSSGDDDDDAASATEGTKSEGEEVEALRALADAAAHTLQQLGKCSMVDGVCVLQSLLLHEYAVAQLAALAGHDGSSKGGDARAGLTALQEQLDAAYAQVQWEVVYAAQSNRPLRTPADLAAVFAPGVAEETIFVQQFVDD